MIHGDDEPTNPEVIRRLRGPESRAAFARRIGVTAQTVYRWELPLDAKEARRPRGPVLSRLRALSRLESASIASTLAPEGPLPSADEPATALALTLVLRGSWAQARSEILTILGQHRPATSPAAPGVEPRSDEAAFASVALALLEIISRSDAVAALVAIGSAQEALARRRLGPAAATFVSAVSALVHAMPYARIFDPARVQAFAVDVDASAPANLGPEARSIAAIALAYSALVVGDQELLRRACLRLDQLSSENLPPLLALLANELRALRIVVAGDAPIVATELLEQMAAASASAGAKLIQARALAMLASQQLDSLSPPEQVLALIHRAREIARGARPAPGPHDVLLIRTEAEALMRLGRLSEARERLDELEAYEQETGLPATIATATRVRALYLTGSADALAALAARLTHVDIAAVAPLCQSHAAYVHAFHALVDEGVAGDLTEAFDRAEVETASSKLLQRDVVLFRVAAFLANPPANPSIALLRVRRFLDRHASAWASTQLSRLEGSLLVASGRVSQGRQLLSAAHGALQTSGCRPDAALAEYALAVSHLVEGDADGETRLETAERHVAELGLRIPFAIRPMIDSARRWRGEQPCTQAQSDSWGVDDLLVALQRLTVRGGLPALIEGELLAVVRDLFGGHQVALAEPHEISSDEQVGSAATPNERVEIPDGSGRRRHLLVYGPLDERGRSALSLLATAAGLAIERARLLKLGGDAELKPAPSGTEIPEFVARSQSMRDLLRELRPISKSRATVLITGETGVGKEVVSRAIHALSPRVHLPFVAFNCATIPRELFEAQLFGYRRGAFTGASSDHPGMIRAASGGTIFFDEIGELPLDVQPKLLRFLENGEIFPIGGREAVTADVRVIAATHRDLAELVKERRFREDLYYRLYVVPIHVPPLRERPDDIPELTSYFLRKLCGNGLEPLLAPDALSRLECHSWPGNVRELRNVIERTLAFDSHATVIRAANLRFGKDSC